jgi:uronate dehydrogenase
LTDIRPLQDRAGNEEMVVADIADRAAVEGMMMLRHYYDRYAIRSVSLRIGTFRPQPIDQRPLATWISPADIAHLVDVSLRHPDPGCLVVNGYSRNTRLKTIDPDWSTPGYQPSDNAEEFRDLLRSKGIDVDGPDRDGWEWPEHGGAFPRTPERPVR